MLYPTTEEVKAAVKTTDVTEYIEPLKMWKKTFYTKNWNKKDIIYKLNALIVLVTIISSISKNKKVTTSIGIEYSYNTKTNVIQIGPNASIISTLHELGHAIWGTQEIDACRFSVALFQQVFPKEFSKLEWRGHMLFRKKD